MRVHDELFALPMADGRGRRPPERAARSSVTCEEEPPTFAYGGNVYRFQHLGNFVGSGAVGAARDRHARCRSSWCAPASIPPALVTDELVGSREIVVKSVGPQIASIRGISGATILGDGRIVIILDMGTLVRVRMARALRRTRRARRATTASSRWWSTTRSPCGA